MKSGNLKFLWIWLALFCAVALIGGTLLDMKDMPSVTAQDPTSTGTPEDEYGNPELLAEVDWLAENLDDPLLAVLDMRPPAEYNLGHIPGAVQVDVASVRATVDGIKAQIPEAETMSVLLGEWGLTPEMTVVIYDDNNLLDAALMFWTLDAYGHADIKLLNGGWLAWDGGELPQETEAPEIEPTEYEVEALPEHNVDREWVLAHLDDLTLQLIDARSPEEFSGETVRAKHGGHIPGAFNMNWTNNLEDGYFKPQADLEALYESLDLADKEMIVTYCQTGHRASVAYFTMRLMGFENVAVYDGSWEDWGNQDDTPIETGL
ncbi:MAG: sulfurtransferase [Chloroflexota bacterium]|nr:sulfurtransferase [Chloroflexota bacterium]NOG63489.1 sulfurtransferase [Chloroflexota bacterium]GIK62349.1 MAG: sulfurtransferase [Chloroflexota bacterium]